MISPRKLLYKECLQHLNLYTLKYRKLRGGSGLFNMALKKPSFLGFFKKPKKSEFRFFKNKNLMSDLSFKLYFTYYATNLIEMLSNFPINMNCIRCVHIAESLQSALLWCTAVNNMPCTFIGLFSSIYHFQIGQFGIL